MQAIHKHIHNPMGDQLKSHKTLLDAIAAELRLRALSGLRTSIIEVNSHIGTRGDEVADKLANVAWDAVACHLTYDIENKHKRANTGQSQTRIASSDQANRQQVAGSLHAALESHLIGHHATTLYVSIQGDLHKSGQSF